MFNKYFVVFRIDHTTVVGNALANRLEIHDNRETLRGFPTKRKLVDWITENQKGLLEFQMLKPIE